jgi:thymidylate synthase
MNNLDKQYTALLQDILDNGVKKDDRTGTGTLSLFGKQIRHKMSDGFPLLTTKKLHFKSIVGELLWFLKGSTDIRELWKDDIKIWDGDWYKQYLTTCSEPYTLEEVKQKVKDGSHSFHDSMFDMGPIYGKQWRNWNRKTTRDEKIVNPGVYDIQIDQIANLINDLKTNPDSRRLMVNAWNVGELDSMVLPPCHYGFQVYTRELSLEERCNLANFAPFDDRFPDGDGFKWDEYTINIAEDWLKQHHLNLPKRAISLMWNQRSVDTFLGLPFNIASYGLLLEIIAKEVNMVPDELIGNLGDTHLYLNHIEQAKEQIGKIPWEERKEMLTNPIDINEFGNISPFTDFFIHHWLDFKKVPYSRRMPYPLPTLKIENEVKWAEGDCLPTYSINDFTIENYQSHPAIKAPLSN